MYLPGGGFLACPTPLHPLAAAAAPAPPRPPSSVHSRDLKFGVERILSSEASPWQPPVSRPPPPPADDGATTTPPRGGAEESSPHLSSSAASPPPPQPRHQQQHHLHAPAPSPLVALLAPPHPPSLHLLDHAAAPQHRYYAYHHHHAILACHAANGQPPPPHSLFPLAGMLGAGGHPDDAGAVVMTTASPCSVNAPPSPMGRGVGGGGGGGVGPSAGGASGGGKRKRSWSRAVFSNLQRKGLEKRFQLQKYITKPDRRQLAATLGLTDAQVKVWFQNRRMKWRHSKEGKLQMAEPSSLGPSTAPPGPPGPPGPPCELPSSLHLLGEDDHSPSAMPEPGAFNPEWENQESRSTDRPDSTQKGCEEEIQVDS